MNSKPSNTHPDIDALVSAANQHVERGADQQQRKEHAARSVLATAPWGKITLLLGALVFLLSQGMELRRQLFGATQAAVAIQAQSVLTAARAAIEQHRKETGELPDRVPLPALDALVTMERSGSDYQLKLGLDGQTWNMDNYGTIKGGI
jgi:hypothetical protein